MTCEHSVTRRVTRTEYDGRITVLADKFNGKRLNSPNDIVVKSDGSIWFTDPPFGIDGDWEGDRAEDRAGAHPCTASAPTARSTAVSAEIADPNGLAFSPDEKKLYVVEGARSRTAASGATTSPPTARLQQDQADRRRRPGALDGFRVDTDGNLWCGWGKQRLAAEAQGMRTSSTA